MMKKEHREKAFGGMSKMKELPALVRNHDVAMGEFPANTVELKRWVVRNVWAQKYEEVWKYGTVGVDGRRREVRFINHEQRFLVLGL
jgi:hypothetical protein